MYIDVDDTNSMSINIKEGDIIGQPIYSYKQRICQRGFKANL